MFYFRKLPFSSTKALHRGHIKLLSRGEANKIVDLDGHLKHRLGLRHRVALKHKAI